MDERIADFLKKQKTATICCRNGEGDPHCFICFYAFDESNRSILFKSAGETEHMQLLMNHKEVAGTIIGDSVKLSSLKGLQFMGTVLPAGENEGTSVYYKRFPFASLFKGTVTTIRLTQVKMTDNTAGFAKKVTWRAEESTSDKD